MYRIQLFCKLIRVKHWIKNILILFPIFFGGKLFDINILTRVCLAIVAFSFLSSLIYILNDIYDLENDKRHFTKRYRPIASGEIQIKSAIYIIFVLGIIVLVVNSVICSKWISWLILIAYFLINFAYSCLRLKNIPLLDVCILVMCYLLRVAYGSLISGIPISNWFFLTIMAIAFFMALGKRKNEVCANQRFINAFDKSETREVLKWYTANYLEKNMYMCMCLAIVFYSMWCMDFSLGDSIMNTHNINIIWTVPIVVVLSMRYSYIIEDEKSDGDPIRIIYEDKPLVILSMIYAMVMLALLYL